MNRLIYKLSDEEIPHFQAFCINKNKIIYEINLASGEYSFNAMNGVIKIRCPDCNCGSCEIRKEDYDKLMKPYMHLLDKSQDI